MIDTDPALFDGGRRLPLVEDFYTIQGEGFHAGKPAYFIRLGGCPVCNHFRGVQRMDSLFPTHFLSTFERRTICRET